MHRMVLFFVNLFVTFLKNDSYWQSSIGITTFKSKLQNLTEFRHLSLKSKAVCCSQNFLLRRRKNCLESQRKCLFWADLIKPETFPGFIRHLSPLRIILNGWKLLNGLRNEAAGVLRIFEDLLNSAHVVRWLLKSLSKIAEVTNSQKSEHYFWTKRKKQLLMLWNLPTFIWLRE